MIPQKKRATMPWMLLLKDIRLLEHDAQSQYKFNRFWVMTWGAAMVVIPFDPTLYAHSISALIIQEVSLWANLATHFSGMSAALAAKNTTQTLSDTTVFVEDISDDIDEIHTVTDKVEDLLPT